MTIRHMKIYLAVYKTQNVTRAAQHLHMTQPAVTRAIREMEEYYGIRLFDRLSRRLTVTEAGRSFYAYALHIVDAFERMEIELRNWDEIGVIRVGTSITLGNALLPGVLSAFRRQQPEIQVRSLVTNGEKLCEALLNNRIDFALIEGEVSDPLLHAQAFGGDRLLPILPPDDPRAGRTDLELEDFAGERLLLRETGSAGRAYLDHVFAAHGVALIPAMESASTRAIIRSVHEGLGVSFLPEQLVMEDICSGYVSTAALKDEAFERRHYMVWHRQKFLSAAMVQLMDAFRRAVE